MFLFVHTLKKSRSLLHNSVLHTFLFPLSLSLLGIVYASRFTAIQFNAYLMLYTFLLINKLLETQLTNRVASSSQSVPRLSLLLETLNVGCLIYFLFNGSLLTIVLPLSYSIIIHFQYVFLAYDMAPLALLLLSVFKGTGIHALAFYLQLNFIPANLFIWCIPMIFPLFLIEENRWKRLILSEKTIFNYSFPNSLSFFQQNKKLYIKTGIVLTFLVGVLILWSQSSWFSLLLLILIPLVWSSPSAALIFQKKRFHLFFLVYHLLYTIILIQSFDPTIAVK